jgi:hypothetical protein
MISSGRTVSLIENLSQQFSARLNRHRVSKEVGVPPNLSVPEFVIDADRINLNKHSIQKYVNDNVRLVGRDQSVEIGKLHLENVLVSTAVTGNWTRRFDLFDVGMNRRSLTRKTLDKNVISKRDAISLSHALIKRIATVSDAVGPLPADESPIAEWKLVADIACGSNFSIQFTD